MTDENKVDAITLCQSPNSHYNTLSKIPEDWFRYAEQADAQKPNMIMAQPDPNQIINMKIVGESGKGYAFKA